MSTGGDVNRIGVFGGTFDPPHIGHLVTALEVREQLDLDLVLLVVANEPWQKIGSRPITPAEIRLRMVETAVADIDSLRASDIEIRRGGPSYTVDTLEALAAEHPGAEMHLVLGSDAAALLHTWHRPEAVSTACRLAVVARPGSEAAVPAGFDGVTVDVTRLDVSSTELRARAARRRSMRLLIPDPVISLIDEFDIYRERR